MARKAGKRPSGERALTPDEVALWRSVMGDGDAPAQPAREPAPAKQREPPPGKADSTKTAEQGAKAAANKRPPPKPPICAKPEVQVVRGRSSLDGLDRRNAQRLRRGQMTIDARLDLHCMTRQAAHAALRRFLVSGTETGHRCVLVITGKGTPRETDANAGFMPDRSLGVLRTEVRRWLAEPDARTHVVAWATAIPRDGGDGALYVLLRRRR